MDGAPLKTRAAWRVLDGFGGSLRSLSRSVAPATVDELAAVFVAARAEGLQVSFRGAGRSYGDASLNTGGLAVDGRGASSEPGAADVCGTVEVSKGTRPHEADPGRSHHGSGVLLPTAGRETRSSIRYQNNKRDA